MRLRTTISALALSAAVIGGGLVASTPALAQATITGGFDVGPGGLQGNFNPLAATAGFTWLVTYFEPLVIYDAELQEVIGALAESYEVSPDQTTYTFKLADTTWHDGTPFTAADAKFTLELAQNEKSGSVFAARLGVIETVEAPDDRTLVVTLSAPTASFLDTLTKVMILPEHALAAIPVEERSSLEVSERFPARNPAFDVTPAGLVSAIVTERGVQRAPYRFGREPGA